MLESLLCHSGVSQLAQETLHRKYVSLRRPSKVYTSVDYVVREAAELGAGRCKTPGRWWTSSATTSHQGRSESYGEVSDK